MWQQVQSFYCGLDKHNREVVDASCGGSFLYKTPEEAWDCLNISTVIYISVYRTLLCSFSGPTF